MFGGEVRKILNRIVEDQSNQTVRRITDNQEEFEYIENLVESTKGKIPNTKHHYLIRTPFRYSLPTKAKYEARFRPPFFIKNCAYYALEARTSAYEYAYHWLSERVHVKGLSQEAQRRTYFAVKYNDPNCSDIRRHRNIKKIMDRNNYSASHDFVSKNPHVSSICYPSCRDPQRGDCFVIFDIRTLETQIIRTKSLNLIYNGSKKTCLLEEVMRDPDASDAIKYMIAWNKVH